MDRGPERKMPQNPMYLPGLIVGSTVPTYTLTLQILRPAGPSTCALSPLPRMGKKNKSLPTIVFDETKRKDYITGFHKRKNERRQHVRSKPARSELLVC